MRTRSAAGGRELNGRTPGTPARVRRSRAGVSAGRDRGHAALLCGPDATRRGSPGDTDTDHRRVGHRRRAGWTRSTRSTRSPPATIDRLREVIGRPPADLEDRAPIVARPGDALEVDEADVVCEDGEVRHVDGELPDDFPLGYHWLQSPEGRRRRLIVSPGRCWLPEDRALGLGRAALRRPQPRQLGHRRPRRPARDPPHGRRPGRRLRADQPAARRRPDPPAGGQPVPAGHPALPQPDLPARRRGARRRRRRPRGGRRPRAVRRRADRPRRDLGPQARGAHADLLRARRRRGLRPLARGAGPDPAGLGDVGGDRRGARRRLAHLAARSCAARRARSSPTTSSSTAPSSPSTPGCSGRWTCSSPPRPAT